MMAYMNLATKSYKKGWVSKETLQKNAYLLVAFLYAIFLASVDIYSSIYFSDILDRANYIYYAEASKEVFAYYSNKSVFSAFVNEPLFLLINWFITLFTKDPEGTVRLLILFSAFQAAYLTLRNGGNFAVGVVILLLPSIYGNYILSLRQGVALAFFLTGWFSKNKFYKFALIGLTPLIHTSFYISLFFMLFEWVIRKFTSRVYLNVAIFSIICIFAILLMPYVGAALGVRQAEGYASIGAGDIKISGFGLIFWLLLLATFISQGKVFLSSKLFPTYCLIFYVLSYVLFPPFARTIQNHAILILISGFYLSGVNRNLFYSLVILFMVYTVFVVVNFGLVSPFLQS